MSVRGWTLAVDWSGHGSFVGTGEDVTSRVRQDDPLTVTIGRESERTTGHAPSGSMSFSLANHDRRYMPEYTSSPIFGLVRPGRRVMLTGTAGASIVPLLAGVLEEYEIDGGAAGYDMSATVLDGWGKPGAEKLSTPLYSGIRTGTAVGLILDAIGWTGSRSIDPGATVMPWWWLDDTDAASAVNDLVDAEGLPAIAYVQGNTFYFRDRHHRFLNSRSTTTQALCTQIMPQGTGPGSDLKIKARSFQYNDGLKYLVNSVSFDVPLRQTRSPAEVWSMDTPITLTAGETTTVYASASDPFFNATVTDLTLRFGTVTATLGRDSGASVPIVLTASTAAVIDRLAVSAISVPVTRTTKVELSDTASIAGYGRQSWTGSSPPFVNAYDAKAIATRLLAVYATRRPSLTFTISGYTAAIRSTLLGLQISDRITVRNDLWGINADFVIERLVYTIHQLDMLEVTIGAQVVEPTQPTAPLTFGVAGLGFNDGRFAVEGIDSASTIFRFDTAGQGFNQGVFGT